MVDPETENRTEKMMTESGIPLPPLELRAIIGPPDLEFFDNPTGEPVYPTLPAEVYDAAVFDFGCGCGRIARLLLQQRHHRPRRYVGIDVHRGLIDWCATHLSPVAPHFLFLHHDVWSSGYGKDNTHRLAEPFPAEDDTFSLVIVPCLFINELDPTSAVVYDRKWFIGAAQRAGLAVRYTTHPAVAGHQWLLQLEKRTPQSKDNFPLGEDASEGLCGATWKPIAVPVFSPQEIERHQVGKVDPIDSRPRSERPQPPVLRGLAAAHAELAAIKNSRSFRLVVTGGADPRRMK